MPPCLSPQWLALQKKFTNWHFGLSQEKNSTGTLELSTMDFVYFYVNFIRFTNKA